MRRLNLLLTLTSLLGCASCSSTSPLACPTAAGRTPKVYFVTDRERDPGPGLNFGRSRTDPPALSTGWCRVDLGAAHRVGAVDDAIALTSDFHTTQTVGVRGSSLQRSDAQIAAFSAEVLRQALRSSTPLPGARRKLLVFVHGYNTTFEFAVRKTAQLAGDLAMVDCQGGSHGVPVAYTWPAQGTLSGYLADEEDAEWTQQRLAPYLRAMSTICRQENADLILMAHSMGSRAVIRSLAELAGRCDVEGRHEILVNQLILMAPDISKALFDQYMERVAPVVGHLTIYVSSKDQALALSKFLHGGNGRLGLVESTLLTALQLTGLPTGNHRELASASTEHTGTKVDMIDVSEGLASTLGHSYDDPAFIRDLSALIYQNAPPGVGPRRNLEPREQAAHLFQGKGGEKVHYFKLGRSDPKNSGATPGVKS